MRRAAWIYVIGVLFGALALSVVAFINRSLESPVTWVFLALTFITTLMRMYHIVAPDHRSYEGSTIAFVAGILLFCTSGGDCPKHRVGLGAKDRPEQPESLVSPALQHGQVYPWRRAGWHAWRSDQANPSGGYICT